MAHPAPASTRAVVPTLEGHAAASTLGCEYQHMAI